MKRVISLLEKPGLPYAYHHFADPPPLPYVVYLMPGERNRDTLREGTVRLELYSEWLSSEKVLDAALDGLDYTKQRQYLETQRMYVTYYEIPYITKEKMEYE